MRTSMDEAGEKARALVMVDVRRSSGQVRSRGR